MSQSDAEANRLMEQQRLGGDYNPDYADGLRDPDEIPDDDCCPECGCKLCFDVINDEFYCPECDEIEDIE